MNDTLLNEKSSIMKSYLIRNWKIPEKFPLEKDLDEQMTITEMLSEALAIYLTEGRNCYYQKYH